MEMATSRMVFAWKAAVRGIKAIYIKCLWENNRCELEKNWKNDGQNLPSRKKLVNLKKWGSGVYLFSIRPDSLL